MTHAKVQVTTTINGEPAEFLCEPRQSLLECLRDVLNLTGTKEGCGDGNCGSCTVMMDGHPVTSCLVLGVEARGSRIGTIEGIARGNELHPLQKSFLENAALQCGICTPGFIVAAKALLDEEPDPSESGFVSTWPTTCAAVRVMTRSSAPFKTRRKKCGRRKYEHSIVSSGGNPARTP
jgi:carbon-monoxide dehydrogenase small subunit